MHAFARPPRLIKTSSTASYQGLPIYTTLDALQQQSPRSLPPRRDAIFRDANTLNSDRSPTATAAELDLRCIYTYDAELQAQRQHFGADRE